MYRGGTRRAGIKAVGCVCERDEICLESDSGGCSPLLTGERDRERERVSGVEKK